MREKYPVAEYPRLYPIAPGKLRQQYFARQVLRLNRALRDMPAPAVRSAELHRWQVTDFVSSIWIALGVGAATLSIVSALYFHLQDAGQEYRLHGTPQHALTLAIGALLRMRLLFVGGTAMCAYLTFMQMYAAKQIVFEHYYLAAGVSILVQLLSLRMTASRAELRRRARPLALSRLTSLQQGQKNRGARRLPIIVRSMDQRAGGGPPAPPPGPRGGPPGPPPPMPPPRWGRAAQVFCWSGVSTLLTAAVKSSRSLVRAACASGF